MTEPSVKGVLLIGSVSALRKRIREGALTREAAEVRLDARYHAFLDEKLDPTAWYPVGAMGEFNELLADSIGPSREEALRSLGTQGVAMVRGTGTYQQVEAEEGSLERASKFEARAFTRMTASVWGAFYNFGKMEVEQDEKGQLSLHLRDVAPLPDAVRMLTEGWVAALTEHVSRREASVTSERTADDHIVYHIHNSR